MVTEKLKSQGYNAHKKLGTTGLNRCSVSRSTLIAYILERDNGLTSALNRKRLIVHIILCDVMSLYIRPNSRFRLFVYYICRYYATENAHIPTTSGLFLMTSETDMTPLHHSAKPVALDFSPSYISFKNFTTHTNYNVKTHEYKHLGFFLYTYFNRKYFLVCKKTRFYSTLAAGAMATRLKNTILKNLTLYIYNTLLIPLIRF